MKLIEDLKHEDEEIRRWAIIDISKSEGLDFVDDLIKALESETEANRRHIVRVLGNIGGIKSIDKLMYLAKFEHGEILGDIAKSLGQLLVKEALPILADLQHSEIQWVSQNSKWAFKQIEANS